MLKNYLKIGFNFLLLLCFTYCLILHSLVIYGIQQGIGQLSIVLEAKKIEEVLATNALPTPLNQKLKLILEIKQFAIDSVGITPNDNYSTFYDQQKGNKLYTLSACEPYEFKAKEWVFPFLGSVSYKGFFDKTEAQKEILSLKNKGYDISIYSPSGWSTLGWFKDPVLSGMLKKKEGNLANLIIHELTHGTLYVKNNVDFNENLANFIGDKGAEKFLMYKYGADSKEYIDYKEKKEDNVIYNNYILNNINRLDSLYKTFSDDTPEKTKRTKKELLINEIVSNVYKLRLHNKKNYFEYTLQAFSEGNAFFMSFKRYDSQYEIFEKEFQEVHQNNLKNYLKALKEKYPSL